jgi:hypothetical protein
MCCRIGVLRTPHFLMTPEEFAAAQRFLGETDDQLAGTLGVTPQIVREWSQGTAQVQPDEAEELTLLVDVKRRVLALESSGLPQCEWIRSHEPATGNTDEFIKHANALKRHVRRCPTCQAREKFLSDRFEPMPIPRFTRAPRLSEWANRVPAIARPAAVGGALVATIVLIRILFSLLRVPSPPREFVTAGVALLAAFGAGGLGGFAYSLTRPLFKRLGRPGDYLTGIFCVFAFIGALAVVARTVFGERMIVEERSAWGIMATVAVAIGVVIGHTLFRSKPTSSVPQN